jgi:hypothetical protein
MLSDTGFMEVGTPLSQIRRMRIPPRSDGENTTVSSSAEDSPNSDASTLSGPSCSVTLKSSLVLRPASEMIMTDKMKAAIALIRQPGVLWTIQIDYIHDFTLDSDYVTIVDDAVQYGD